MGWYQNMRSRKLYSQDVYEKIKERILSLEYPPGQALTEMSISKDLGVSRTPIREAFKLLEKERLVVYIPNRGTFVKDITMTDIKEIFMIRELIEGFCASVAASLIDDENIKFLENTLDKSIKAFEKGEYKESSIIASDIHNVIVAVVGNNRIKEILFSLEQDISRIQNLTSEVPEKLRKSNEQHKDIVEALKIHDSQLAQKKMMEHIKSVEKDAIFEYITKTCKYQPNWRITGF